MQLARPPPLFPRRSTFPVAAAAARKCCKWLETGFNGLWSSTGSFRVWLLGLGLCLCHCLVFVPPRNGSIRNSNAAAKKGGKIERKKREQEVRETCWIFFCGYPTTTTRENETKTGNCKANELRFGFEFLVQWLPVSCGADHNNWSNWEPGRLIGPLLLFGLYLLNLAEATRPAENAFFIVSSGDWPKLFGP